MDQEHFAEFAAARQHQMLRVAFLLCGDRGGAEDLVQTTLLHLYRAWPRARRADSIEAYAHRTLVNTFIRSSSRLRREQDHHRKLHPDESIAAEDDGVALRITLLAALDRLGSRSRAMLILRYWLDLSVEQTAHVMRCSTGNVKSQTSRALAQLRKDLAGSFPELNISKTGNSER